MQALPEGNLTSDKAVSGDKPKRRACNSALRLLNIINMAEFKRRMLVLSTGKQIKLFGTSIAIGKSLEIGEGYAPNILSTGAEAIVNPHGLTLDELLELADYSMQLWMDLKTNLRKYGLDGSKIFSQEALR